MSVTAFLLTCITVLNLSIGLYVYRRDPAEPSHRAFGFMSAMIGLWTIGLIGAHYGPSGHTFSLRVAFAAASLIPLGVLSFVENTPRHCLYQRTRISRVFRPVALALSIASFSPLIVVSVSRDDHSSSTHYGPLHPVFALIVVSCFVYSIYVLV